MYDLSFEPKKEDELIDLLEKGDGDYEVIKAVRKDSKSNGLPMIELQLKVWDHNGTQGLVYDYLMLTGSKFSLRKIRHFCYSNGMESFYESGKLSASDCEGKTGKCYIGIQKDKNGQYPDKNIIADYTMSNVNSNSLNNKNGLEPPVHDDDIPF